MGMQKRQKMLHHSMYMIHTKICQYEHYKNKEHVQRHVCVSIYLCKGNSEIGIVIWQRSENIYNQHTNCIPSYG